MAHDHILRRAADPPAVLVVAGLEHHAVIAGAEDAVFNQHIAAGIRIHAIIVRSVGIHGHAADGEVPAIDRMNRPVRPAADGEPFQQDFRAVHQAEETRTDRRFGSAENALLDRHSLRAHFEMLSGFLLGHGPPRLGIAIQTSLAGDRDVRAIVRIDERRVVVNLDASTAHENRWQVILETIAENDLRSI